MKTVHWGRLAAAGALSLAAATAHAEVIGGVEFPQGAISFADAVVSYTLNPASIPGAAYQGAFNALGAPDYNAANSCANQASCSFVTLGAGGELVLRFTDNVLTGSGSNAFDLWIFEIGPDVEDTIVDVSVDGVTWLSVGSVTGSTRGIDIDVFGFGTASAFSYVRLIDVFNEGGTGSGGTAGADIDAVGAISTRRVDTLVPEPGTWALMLLGFGVLGTVLRRSGRLAAA
ncbi:MAG: PEPxxWA-CTERM sorting domain-containing protein [Pseudomonadota bacterium]